MAKKSKLFSDKMKKMANKRNKAFKKKYGKKLKKAGYKV